MAYAELSDIFGWFKTGDYPTEQQFQATWSSFWWKGELIPVDKIAGLTELLEDKADSDALQYYALKDAGNIDVPTWQEKLGVSGYQIYDSRDDAFQQVPPEKREVGKMIAIYRDVNKTDVILYTWANLISGWTLQPLGAETGTYVAAIGDVMVASDVVTVTTPISIYFDFVEYTLDEWVDLSFDPVSDGNIKVLVVYALPDSQLIYLAEGLEGNETTEPNLPDGALFIRRGIATSAGVAFDPETDLIGYKKKAEDNWLRVPYRAGSNITLEMTDERQNFYMTGGEGTGTTMITSIKLAAASSRAFDFKIYNGGVVPITLDSVIIPSIAPINGGSLVKKFSTDTAPLIIPPKKVANLKYDPVNNLIDILKSAEAGDGKNVTNASNTTTGSYTQTQRVGDTWIWDTNGQSWSVKNLPNKSADANFTDIVGKNPNGQFAKVGFPALKSMISDFSQDQALEISQLLNAGQGSAGLMSVNTIAPPLFERENNNVYLVLRGANLYLSSIAFSVHIVRASDNAVLAQVPNSQVQLYADGLSLVFNYNFYALGNGDYKIRLTSGSKVLITSLQFKIVASVENINISAITWNKLVDTSLITSDMSTASGGNLSLLDNQYTATTTNPIISFLSSQLFAQGDDFYIELQVTSGSRYSMSNQIFKVGICYSSTPNALSFLPMHFWEYWKSSHYSGFLTRVNTNANGTQYGTPQNPKTFILSITKVGNTLTITDGTQIGIMTISNNSGYSLVAQLAGSYLSGYDSSGAENPTIQVLKAFKIV